MDFVLLTIVFVLPQDDHRADGEPADVRCGAYCLYVALRSLNLVTVDFDAFEKAVGQPSPHGYSLLTLADAAAAQGASAAMVTTDLDTLLQLRQPFACIALLKHQHFVCVSGVTEGMVQIVDPPDEYTVNRPQFEEQWDGTALLISASPLVLPKRGLSPLTIAFMICGILLAGGVTSSVLIRYIRKPRSEGR